MDKTTVIKDVEGLLNKLAEKIKEYFAQYPADVAALFMQHTLSALEENYHLSLPFEECETHPSLDQNDIGGLAALRGLLEEYLADFDEFIVSQGYIPTLGIVPDGSSCLHLCSHERRTLEEYSTSEEFLADQADVKDIRYYKDVKLAFLKGGHHRWRSYLDSSVVKLCENSLLEKILNVVQAENLLSRK